MAAALLAGCTVGPQYHRPNMPVPAAWSELGRPPPATQPTTLPSVTTARPVQITQWWATFRDPVLDDLVAQAVRSNLDLRLAGARLVEARSRRGVVAGTLYPQVNADGNYTHARVSQTGIPIPTPGNPRPADLSVRRGRAAPGGSGGGSPFGFGPNLDLFQLGFDASWEVDLFGGVRRQVEAADADIAAGIEDRRDVLVSMMAEVARNYLELRGTQRQLAIARANLAAQQGTLRLTRERREAGMVTELDVARAASEVATTAAQIPALDAQARAAIHRLGVLLGREPSALAERLGAEGNPADAGNIPPVPPEVPVGLPSDVLRRRPDIRRAERELAAATARTGAATADLFPRFTLTGAGGLQTLNLGDLFQGNSAFYSIGPGVTWPIFDAGRIRSNIRVQGARQEQALIRYQQAVLTALRDVEDALSNYAAEQVRRQSLAEAVAADRQAVAVARDRYAQGVIDFLTVLDAERSQFRSESALADSDRTVATDLVALYKALGGGWEVEMNDR